MIKNIILLLVLFASPVFANEDLKILKTSVNEERQVQALRKLSKITGEGADEIVPSLANFAKNRTGTIQLEAILALGKLGKYSSAKALPVLIELSKSNNSLVRIYTTNALLGLRYKAAPALSILEKLMLDRHPMVRRLALRAVILVGLSKDLDDSLSSISVLAKYSKNKNVNIQDIGLEGLVRLSDNIGGWTENEHKKLTRIYCLLIRKGMPASITRKIFLVLVTKVAIKNEVGPITILNANDNIESIVIDIKKQQVSTTGICIFLNSLKHYSAKVKQSILLSVIKHFFQHKDMEVKKSAIRLVRNLSAENQHIIVPELKKFIGITELAYTLSSSVRYFSIKEKISFYLEMTKSKDVKTRRCAIDKLKYMRKKAIPALPALKELGKIEKNEDIIRRIKSAIRMISQYDRPTRMKLIEPWHLPYERMP